jgi:hypothetical protein
VTSPRKRRAQPRTAQPAARPAPAHWQPSKEDLLELREPYDFEFGERPDGWPVKPFEWVIVVAASDWYKEHFPADAANLQDALHPRHDRQRDPEPDLEAEP